MIEKHAKNIAYAVAITLIAQWLIEQGRKYLQQDKIA